MLEITAGARKKEAPCAVDVKNLILRKDIRKVQGIET
jgi:hypothetical protein